MASAQSSALSILPRGAYADPLTSTTKTWQVGHEYHFRFVGDETLEYVIKADDPVVAGGVIRIHELTTDSYPIHDGGLAWLDSSGGVTKHASGYLTPLQITADGSVPNGHPATLYGETLDPSSKKLVLQYQEDPANTGKAARKTYEFWLVGKVLRVHAFGDLASDSQWLNNYAFFHPGPSTQTPFGSNAEPDQHVPYMDNVFVVRFNASAGGATRFFAVYPDWYASNGSAATFALGNGVVGSAPPYSSFEKFYPMLSLRSDGSSVSPWKTLLPVDETMNVIVCSTPGDAFPVPPHYRSPCYQMSAGRMTVFGAAQQPGAWTNYTSQYEHFKDWGLSDLAILQYRGFKWSDVFLTPDNGPAGAMGLDPSKLANLYSYTSTINGIRVLDQTDPSSASYQAIAAEVAAAWGSATSSTGLVPAARALGALFAHTVVHDLSDQWGFGVEGDPTGKDYPASSAHSVPASNNRYPSDDVNLPFSFGFWTDAQGFQYGLKFPTFAYASSHTPYVDSRSVRDWNGNITPGWDIGLNTHNSAWVDASGSGYGYKSATVDAGSVKDHLLAQLNYGLASYGASAALYDASGILPAEFRLEERVNDPDPQHPHCRSTGQYLIKIAAADRATRDAVGGPLYGESNYWRWAAAYDYGARDGFRAAFPADDTHAGSSNVGSNWVIPDYMLTEILAKAAGNCGQAEAEHDGSVSLPVIDGPADAATSTTGGDVTGFADSYFTTLATYGLNPFVDSNGDVPNDWWSAQGVLREYALLCPVARRMREGKVTEVRYFSSPADMTGVKLGEALAAGTFDLKRPLIRITLDNGLVFCANHTSVAGSVDWAVPTPIPTLGGGSEGVTLKPNGFAAGDGSQIFVVFNGIPASWPNALEPMDYAKFAGRWEMINYRRVNNDGVTSLTQLHGFPDSAVTLAIGANADLLSEGLIMKDVRQNLVLGAAGGQWDPSILPSGDWLPPGKVGSFSLGTAPTATAVTILADPGDADPNGTQTIYTLKPKGYTARLNYSNGSWQDVTTLATWSASWNGTGPIAVKNGVVTITPTAPVPVGATATISAGYPGAIGQVLFVGVADGKPTANAGADLTAAAGSAVTLDGSLSADPKQGNVICSWDFGDATTGRGRVVSHVYTAPRGTPYTATLTVTDIHGNASTDTAAITVTTVGSTLWASSFDDGLPAGLSSDIASGADTNALWGNAGLALKQSMTASGVHQETIQGLTWLQSSTGAEINLLGPATSGKAGIAVRKSTYSGLPTTDGYNASINTSRALVVREGATQMGTGILLTGLDLNRRHDMRLVTGTNQSGQTTVRVYVDGAKKADFVDATNPQGQGYSGVWTENRAALFDDLRVADRAAPYITTTPSDLDTNASPVPTTPSFYIDDQDFFSDISQSRLTLVIKAEDGPSAGLPGGELSYADVNGSSSVLVPMTAAGFTYETGSALTSTWAKLTLAHTVEWYMDTQFGAGTNQVSFEWTAADAAGHTGRKFVRFVR